MHEEEEEEEGRDGGDRQPSDVDGACWKLREGGRKIPFPKTTEGKLRLTFVSLPKLF